MTTLRSILKAMRPSRPKYEDVHRKDLFDDVPAKDRRKRS
jgi:hypothetical protein